MKNLSNKTSLTYVAKEVASADLKYIFVTEFNDDSLAKFYEKFVDLNSDNNIKAIPIVISSYGGQVYSLLGMLDIMAGANKPVATVALGKAMSCGAILLSAGTKGYRYAGENSTVLIHEISTLELGKNTEIQNRAKETRKLNTKLMRILAANCGQKQNFFSELLKEKTNVDLHFTSVEAKALGFIDHISIPKLLRI